MNTIGFIGLGRMGKNMILHLLEEGINVVAYNRTKQVTDEFADEVETQTFASPQTAGQLTAVYSVSDLTSGLASPRIIILMVKAGEAVDHVITELLENGVQPDDIIIDAGNSFFEDTKRRFDMLKEKKIHYIDSGTSGGMEGARNGACLMLGGEQSIVESLDYLWNALAGINGRATHSLGESGRATHSLGGGWNYFGPAGAGHFVKMVHNGVEYGIDQAIGEGFALIEKSPYNIDLAKVAGNWTKGSVVRGWLVELLERALQKDPKLEAYIGKVGGGETGKWTTDTAEKLGVPQTILAQAIKARQDTQSNPTFAGKVVSALRFEYGGHLEDKK